MKRSRTSWLVVMLMSGVSGNAVPLIRKYVGW